MLSNNNQKHLKSQEVKRENEFFNPLKTLVREGSDISFLREVLEQVFSLGFLFLKSPIFLLWHCSPEKPCFSISNSIGARLLFFPFVNGFIWVVLIKPFVASLCVVIGACGCSLNALKLPEEIGEEWGIPFEFWVLILTIITKVSKLGYNAWNC